ncbi:GNAT family N-acetyltransferase [Virgibacillus halophilus]|uniref:GNAT family N-acetyltransferase n=1 Tax=Tigheibacillus halophilus TaxID=361280 RepID=A0ABU5CC88_9BACI|nr:GNAT family N-acetyltransferase [Virgibacillus halophilus]
MEIRRATFKEVQKIRKHALSVLKESTMDRVRPSIEKARHMTSASLDGSSYYLVYVEESEIKGWAAIGATFDFYTDKMVGIITELYVFPEERRKGIAKKLCRQSCNHLQNKGFQKVQLNVFAGNDAIKLYEKLGFYEVSRLLEKKLHD